MNLRIVLAVLHLLALGVGMGAVYGRGRALGKLATDRQALGRGLTADGWWGLAALLWLSTGLWRLFAGTEKATSYYMTNHIFFAKMGFFVLVFLLELWPMITLLRWRSAQRAGTLRESSTLARTGWKIARICDVQLMLMVAIVVCATMMARGYGAR